jgi:hypothetical protein
LDVEVVIEWLPPLPPPTSVLHPEPGLVLLEAPDRTWYVVNHFAASDPATRPLALASNPEDVEIFGNSGGAIIESRLLFDMLADVDTGSLTTDEARATLRDARGRLMYARRTPGT